jgi:hypothetical protein
MAVGSIAKLNHNMTFYKTQQSYYSDLTSCMKGTHVEVLEDLNT